MNKRLKTILEKHTELRQSSLNLLPSENVLSPLAKKFMSSDFGQRYFFKSPYSTANGISYSYSGTDYIDQIVSIGEELARDLFKAKFVSLYPISGHQANIAILFAYTKPGDSIIVFNPAFGGYPGLDKDMLPKYLRLNVHYLPVVPNNPELIDYKEAKKLIEKVKPKLVIYSSAHTLFPININELTNNSHNVGALFVYDGSHPLGLIAGGVFQDPLQEGADFLIGGTQKSFPGPQGGIIATNIHQKMVEKVGHFVIVDNPHFHRIAALTVTLAEMKEFGNIYAEQVITNTKCLANELFNAGFSVKYYDRNFSESHMFKVNLDEEFLKLVKTLENAGIMLDSAGRIGLGEMTRIGMKENHMKQICELILQVKKGGNISRVKENVTLLRSNFDSVDYGYS